MPIIVYKNTSWALRSFRASTKILKNAEDNRTPAAKLTEISTMFLDCNFFEKIVTRPSNETKLMITFAKMIKKKIFI